MKKRRNGWELATVPLKNILGDFAQLKSGKSRTMSPGVNSEDDIF